MPYKFIIAFIFTAGIVGCLQPNDPGEQPTADKNTNEDYLDKTRKMVKAGKYSEALERYRWFDAHILEQDPELAGVRRSFALAYWKELGDVYPPAMDALKDNRESKTGQLIAKGTSSDLFAEVAAINSVLGENTKTIALFEIISSNYPGLAKDACRYVLDDLLDAKKYELVKKNIGDPLDHYKRIESAYKKSLEELGQTHKDLSTYMKNNFTKKTTQLIRYCLAVNDLVTAEEIQTRSMLLANNPRG
ncbi:MAG: hypothetical protein ABI688_07160 [Bacteroidota bacterium]